MRMQSENKNRKSGRLIPHTHLLHMLGHVGNSDDKELGGGKPPVNMNSFLWVNVPSNNPRCVVCNSCMLMDISHLSRFTPSNYAPGSERESDWV